jgi:hypothetical protein
MPAHGKPECTGSALTATSPTALNRFSQRITLSASSFKVTVRPANVNVHLFSTVGRKEEWLVSQQNAFANEKSAKYRVRREFRRPLGAVDHSSAIGRLPVMGVRPVVVYGQAAWSRQPFNRPVT